MESITKTVCRKGTGDAVETEADIVVLDLHGEEVCVNLVYVPDLVSVKHGVHSKKKFLGIGVLEGVSVFQDCEL